MTSRITVRGRDFINPDGSRWLPAGTNARWGAMKQSDMPYLASLGFTALRNEIPIYQTGVAGDAYDPLSPQTAYLSQAYLDTLDQIVDWAEPYLKVHPAIHSKCYRSGLLDDGVSPDPYCGDTTTYPDGANLWSDPSKKALWLLQVAFIANRYKNRPHVWAIEIMNESDPTGYNDAAVNAMMALGVDTVREIDQDMVVIVGGNGGYANFKIAAAYMPTKQNVAYTWDHFDQPGPDLNNPNSIVSRIASLDSRFEIVLAFQADKNVALFCNQFGSRIGVDPDRIVLAHQAQQLTDAGIGWTQWEYRAPGPGPATYGWVDGSSGTDVVRASDPAILGAAARRLTASAALPVPGPRVPDRNPGVVYVEKSPVFLVSLLSPTDTLYPLAPKVIDGNVREQMMLADALTGAPLDLRAEIAGAQSAYQTDPLYAARQVTKSGYTVLWLTASATGGRCNNFYGIQEPRSYSRAGGIVQVDCAQFDWVDNNRRIKVAFAQRSDLTAICEVLDFAQQSGDTTRLLLRELYTTSTRPDIAPGTITDPTGLVHDLQSGANCHPQITMLNAMLGGVLEVYNFGIGGSNTSDWVPGELRDYLDGLPLFDFVFCDFGYGNDLTEVFSSSADIFARIDEPLTWAEGRGRQVFMLGAEGARPGGDATPEPNPWATADFTSLQLLNRYMRAWLQTRHHNVRYVEGETRFMRAATRGAVDTYSLRHGLPPQEFLDNKGIHRTPTGGLDTARGLAEAVLPFVSPYPTLSNNYTDCIAIASVPDLGGLRNPNLLLAWYGDVPTIEVLVFGLIFIGTGVDGTSADGSGFTGNMSGSLEMFEADGGGRGMRLYFNDPVDGGATFNLYYRGYEYDFTDDHSQTVHVDARILTQINDPANQGVDLDLIGKFEFGGFNEDSLLRFTAGLFAIDTDSGQAKCIAAWYSDSGVQGMVGGQRAWTCGPNGIHRAGNGPIVIPTDRVFTDAWIQFTWEGTPLVSPAFPMGEMWAEIEELQLSHRRLLATPAAGSWS